MAPEARLTAEFWVQAYLARLRLNAIPAYVVHHGHDQAGAVLIKTSRLNGSAVAHMRSFTPAGMRVWAELVAGPETQVDAAIQRQRGYDPDLWVIEVEDRQGRNLLDQPGLAD